jgi:Asp-tRNA(Asn)/Glu-tRNA(Gln) amidotransferase A subunit family amidase
VLAIVRAAADTMAGLGADVTEVEIPGLPDVAQMRPLSLVSEEMESDLDAYFAARPTAPVRSLREIVASGRCIPQVTSALSRSLDVDHADWAGCMAKIERRAELRLAVLGAMAARQLDALLYPVMRIESPTMDASAPYNVALAPCTGLPAIAIPAGFTANGMPVGIELLGRAWSEPRLLGLSYAYEQATHHRRPPMTTPALDEGAVRSG